MISGVVRTSVQPAMQLLRERLPAVRAVCSAFSATLAAFAHEASVWLHLVCVCVHCMVKILFASQEKKKPRFSNGVRLFVSLPLVFDGA